MIFGYAKVKNAKKCRLGTALQEVSISRYLRSQSVKTETKYACHTQKMVISTLLAIVGQNKMNTESTPLQSDKYTSSNHQNLSSQLSA